MKTWKQPIVALFFITAISPVISASFPAIKIISFRKNSKISADTSAAKSYIRKALDYATNPAKVELMRANIDSAELFCSEEKIEFPSLLFLARAEYFFLTSDYTSALQEATLARNRAETSGEPEVLANTMHFLGRYNLRTGFYNESIDWFNNSIAIARKNRLKGIIPRSYSSLKDVYYILQDQKEFRNNLYLLIDAAENERDTIYLESGYFRLGTSFTSDDRNFTQADSLLRKCMNLALIRNDTSFITLSLANLGWNYYLEKRYDDALESYKLCLSYSIPAKLFSNSANCYGNIGTIYRDLGNIEQSLSNYHKSIELAREGEDIYSLMWVYEDMSDMYLRIRDTSNAYKTYVLFKRYSDTLMKSTNTQGLTDARIRYEADSRNKELELLSLRVKNQRLLIYGYTGLFVLSIAIGLLILSRSKINAKRRISEMNRKVAEVTQANLRQQMNPHFIFNTLNSIQYYMYQHDKLATNNYLTKFSSLMRKVLENSQHTSVTLRDELDALKLYLELEIIRFKEKFEYKIYVDEEIDTLLYKVPTMLIQPYVENSICHGLMPSEEKGLIKIDLHLNSDYILCTIEDNGIGRKAAQEKRKAGEKNHNSLGTKIVSSRLDLVNALYGTSLKTVYTDLKNEIGEPMGTRVEIHIPIIT